MTSKISTDIVAGGMSTNMDPTFLEAQNDLVIFLKEGYSFWGANAELIARRFANPQKTTTVVIVHPDSGSMPQVAEMDRLKTQAIQRSDCIETVRILQTIRDVVRQQGSAEAKDSFDDCVTFVGHHYVPSWNGCVGDTQAVANFYDTGPAPRGSMPSMTVEGALRDRFHQNCKDIVAACKMDPATNLFDFHIPADHTDLRAERTREIGRSLIERAVLG